MSSVISATFSEDMDSGTINSTSFTVDGVTGTVTLTGHIATFTPTSSLSPSTTYTATIAASASDLAGNQLGDDYTWGFTTAGPVPVADMPLTTARTWTYDLSWTRDWANLGRSEHNQQFDGTLVLDVEGPVSWQSRNAWRLVRYDIGNLDLSLQFDVTVLYVFQSAAGLEIWVPTAAGGEWRRILSRSQHSFSANAFLLAGLVASDPRGSTTTLSRSSTTVTAGSYSTVLARALFTQSGDSVPADIVEYRSEHYADGVGLVRGLWSYDFRAHDPAPGDLIREFQEGTIQLSQGDAGTYADVLTEAEPNDSGTPTGSQAIPRAGLVSARIARSDAGMNVNNPEVYPNIFGSKTIQDWYRFTMPTAGDFRLDLAGQGPQFLNGSTWNDLDMYLFREEFDGSLTYVARAFSLGVGGGIAVPSLAAGTYHIGVMAYQTAGPIDYWFVTR